MKRLLRLLAVALALAAPLGLALAAPPPPPPPPAAPPPPLPAGLLVAPTPAEAIAAAPAADWRTVAPENLMILTLKGGGQVLVELAPVLAPKHIANLRRLIAARWFDGTAVVRVQDNYVTQWGDPGNTKPMPEGVAAKLAPEWEQKAAGVAFTPIPGPDGYGEPGFVDSFPAERGRGLVWAAHCYGAVGVGRDAAPDSGNASELYTIIGTPPRNLDRNYTVIGRVVAGMERLSALPRGTGNLGFYETEAERTPVVSVRLASDLPEGERPRVEVLRSDRASFAAYVRARANRPEYINPHGFVDLCNVRPPVRVKAE